jgi:hypothetical protein
MGFKKTTRKIDFADLAMASCLEKNSGIKLMEQLNNTIKLGIAHNNVLPARARLANTSRLRKLLSK